MKFHPASTVFALPVLLALVVAPAARGQQDSASAPSAARGNKAARPVEQAAPQSDVATRKPAKAGAQSGPQSADAAAAKGDKAGKPPVAEAASRAGVATKKPAKRGTQSGPSPASAPDQ
jgi:hypothetical protein